MSQLTLQPDAAAGVDTYLAADTVGINYGADGLLIVGSEFSGKFRRGLVRFDLRSLLGVASIDGATLVFKGWNNLASQQNFTLYRCTRGALSGAPWTNLGATWSKYDGANDWTTPGGDYDPTAGLKHVRPFSPGPTGPPFFFSSNDWIDGNPALGEYGMTAGIGALVVDALANRGGYLDLLILGPELGGGVWNLQWATSDYVAAGNGPSITIDYTAAVYARRNRTRRTGTRSAP